MKGGGIMDPQKFYDLLFKLYAEQEKIKIEYTVKKILQPDVSKS